MTAIKKSLPRRRFDAVIVMSVRLPAPILIKLRPLLRMPSMRVVKPLLITYYNPA